MYAHVLHTWEDHIICICAQVESGDFPHLMVYGPSGAGKKTRIMCVLRELYGSGVGKLRIEHMNFVVSRLHSRSVAGLRNH